MEIWKVIPKYPFCEASDLGRIRYIDMKGRHAKTKQIRPQKLGGFGYLQVSINGTTESVHNLVTEAFHGLRPGKGYRADHIDENDKLNNTPSNLRWLIHGHNTMRSSLTGGRRYFYEGELWLMKRLLSHYTPMRLIGKMFKCSTMLLSDVKKGLKDNHLKGEPQV